MKTSLVISVSKVRRVSGPFSPCSEQSKCEVQLDTEIRRIIKIDICKKE